MDMKITFAERFRTAKTVLLGRGDDAIVCSFCGRDRHQVGHLVRGPGATICSWCTTLANGYIMKEELVPAPGKTIDWFLVMEEPAKALPAFRASVETCLSQTADELQCKLLTWTYSNGGDAMSDSLSVAVEVEEGTNVLVFRETFNRMTLIGALGS